MASGPRQFVAKFISNFENFNTDRAARGLEELGDEYQQTERRMESMEDSARDTARGVDDAFDRIRAASRNTGDSFRQVEGDAHEGFSGVRDEAADTGREVAASFDGSMESILEGFQELGANAGAAFGPVGLGIGLAAAAGFGILNSRVQDGRENVNNLYQTMRDVERGTTTLSEAVVDFVDNLDARDFIKFNDEAKKYGLTVETMAKANLGNTEALAEMLVAQNKYEDSLGGIQGGITDLIRGYQGLIDTGSKLTENIPILGGLYGWLDEAIQGTTGQIMDAAEASVKSKEATEAQQEAIDNAATASDAFATVTESANDRVVESHKDAEGNVVYSLDTIGAALDEQTRAAEDYATNVAIALQRGISQDAVDYLMELPDGGARAFGELAAGTDESIREINGKVDNFNLAEGMTQTIRDEKGNLIRVTSDNIDAVQQRINNAGLAAKIQVSLNGERTVQETLARLSAPETKVIRVTTVGGNVQATQGSRRIY